MANSMFPDLAHTPAPQDDSHLSGSEYITSHQPAFPRVSADDISRLVRQGLSLKRRAWLTELRKWIHEIQYDDPPRFH